MKGGSILRICALEGCSNEPRTMSVSMKPKYAQPTRAWVTLVSIRKEFVNASTPAFDAA